MRNERKVDISCSNLYPGNDHISHFFQVPLSDFPAPLGGVGYFLVPRRVSCHPVTSVGPTSLASSSRSA